MKSNKTSPDLSQIFQKSLVQFFGLSIAWFITILFLRGVELGYSRLLFGSIASFFPVLLKGLLYDVIYFFKSLYLLFILHSVLATFSLKWAKYLFITWVVLLTLLQLSLSQYFLTALVPLGADLYSYSIADIKQTVGAAGGVPIVGVLAMIVVIGVILTIFIKLAPKLQVKWVIAVLLPILSLIVTYSRADTLIQSSQFEGEYLNYLTLNKSLYFGNASYGYFFESDSEVDIYADNYLGIGGTMIEGEEDIKPIEYIAESEYPFLRRDSTADVLGPFLKQSDKKPNIVILIVEGLGRAFTGEGAYLGSFTPFIDSLANKSLYWSNFLSEGGRTFAVLPSLLGSLPFGKAGFNELGSKMPSHLTLLSLLRKNGYQSAFYYGGDSKFDNMNMFLKKGGVDVINDEPTFGSGYQKLPGGDSGFSWGYDDKSLFKRYFDVNPATDSRPKVQVVLTVSTHSPFRISNQPSYVQKVEERMTALKFTAMQRNETRPYNNMLSTVMYMDEAVKYFFNEYSKRPDFANTIFFITGDHRLPEIPMATKIDRYHVPLIVYSPLLKRTSKFQSISTHFDITPTIVAYLNKNYGLQRPAVTNWLGNGIDTVRQFRNVHAYPLMMTKSQMIDFVKGTYMINNSDLYQLTPSMGMVLTTDKGVQSTLKGGFDAFRQKNNRMLNGSKLVPDSVITRFIP